MGGQQSKPGGLNASDVSWPSVMSEAQVARLIGDRRFRVSRAVPNGIVVTARSGRNKRCVRYTFEGRTYRRASHCP